MYIVQRRDIVFLSCCIQMTVVTSRVYSNLSHRKVASSMSTDIYIDIKCPILIIRHSSRIYRSPRSSHGNRMFSFGFTVDAWSLMFSYFYCRFWLFEATPTFSSSSDILYDDSSDREWVCFTFSWTPNMTQCKGLSKHMKWCCNCETWKRFFKPKWKK